MSQFFVGSTGGGGGGPITTLEGNDGNPVTPTGGIIGVIGTGVVSSGVSTAGNIYTTGSGSNLTINETKAQFLTNYTAVNIGMSPYTAVLTDYMISVNSSAGVVTIRLPNSPTIYRAFVIKDRTGNALANNVQVTTVSGAVSIDGVTTYLLDANFEAGTFIFNGTSYEVI